MNKYKYLFKNVGLLAIGQFGSRLLSFFLVPLYTTILTTSDYGTFDLYNTIIQLLVPLLTLNIYDGILRFALDGKNDIRQVYAIGFSIFSAGTILLSIFILVNLYMNTIPIINQYPLLFFLFYVVNSMQLLLNNFARGLDDVSATVISGIISTIVMIVLNVWFLIGLRWELFGYFAANIIGIGAGCLLYVFRLRLWKYPLVIHDWNLGKSMVHYSAPLVVNSVSWWINSASSRYIIIGLVGLSANGLFSAANKVPSIISMAANLFNSAWVMSSVKEFDSQDKEGFFSNTYKIFSALIVLCCSLLIVTSNIIGGFLYRGDFHAAWELTPCLTLGAVFSALAGCLGGIFAAAKKTAVFAYSTFTGCVTNIVIGIVLTFFFGVMGAVVAITISNYVILIIRFIQIRKFMNVRLCLFRDHVVYLLLILQSILMVQIEEDAFLYLLVLLLLFCVLFLYRKEYSLILRKISGDKTWREQYSN